MPKHYDYLPKHYDYFEWDPEDYAAAARRPAAEFGDVEILYDREIRMRVGDLIARAMRAADNAVPEQGRSVGKRIR